MFFAEKKKGCTTKKGGESYKEQPSEEPSYVLLTTRERSERVEREALVYSNRKLLAEKKKKKIVSRATQILSNRKTAKNIQKQPKTQLFSKKYSTVLM